jgi:hypothetical protein
MLRWLMIYSCTYPVRAHLAAENVVHSDAGHLEGARVMRECERKKCVGSGLLSLQNIDVRSSSAQACSPRNYGSGLRERGLRGLLRVIHAVTTCVIFTAGELRHMLERRSGGAGCYCRVSAFCLPRPAAYM